MIWAFWMLAHFLEWWKSHRGQVRRIPPFALFVLAVVVLIPISYVTVLASSTWDLFNYFGVGPVNPLLNQVLFWFFGHGIVYILFLIPITAFYFLVPIFAKRPIYSYRAAFVAAIIFTVLTPLLSIHHLYLTPVPPWSAWLTGALTFLIIIPSAITFFTIWMTTKGVRKGDWQWNAVTLFLLLSFAGTMAGGLTGPDNNTLGFDIDLHNTLFIVSHFHALALLSIAAGGFAVVYAAFPLLAGRLWYSPRLAQAHFVSTAIGWSGLVMFMDLLGSDGILRRSLIFPLTPAVVQDQVWLTVFVIVSIAAQLFFVANVLLTVFKGELLTVQGLSLDEIVRKMAQSTHPTPTVPIADVPFVRRTPRPRRERAERTWITVVVVLVVGVLLATSPLTLTDSTAIGSPADPPSGSEYLSLVSNQYYWSVGESGPIVGSFSDVMVVHAGQWVAVNATASGRPAGSTSRSGTCPRWTSRSSRTPCGTGCSRPRRYRGSTAPRTPRYNGPWFGQDMAALVVLPSTGTANLSAYQANGGEGDIYDPPVLSANGAFLIADQEGLFDNSVPGPTLTAAPGTRVVPGTDIPTSSIGVDNYLVNVTSTDPNGQLDYVIAHNYTLPYQLGIYAINTTGGGLVSVTSQPLKVGSVLYENATLPRACTSTDSCRPSPTSTTPPANRAG